MFTLEQLYDRKAVLGTSAATKLAIEKLGKKFVGKIPPLGSTSWVTPYGHNTPAADQEVELGPAMRWIRTQIVAALGTAEEVVHVLNWRHSTVENEAIDAPALKTFGQAVKTAWDLFLTDVTLFLPTDVVYTEVRTSVLNQTAPATKPDWELPTQVAALAAASKGTSTQPSLPYEVALGLSLNTNFRGTSRFRGRLYMPPLPSTVMQAGGRFNPATTSAIGAAFGTRVLQGVEAATDYEAHVISQKYGTSAKITGVRTGSIPDSQRRRRRDQVENFVQNWGTPVGAL